MAITINDIKNLSDQDIKNMSNDEIRAYAKQAEIYAYNRRERALKYLMEHPDTPLPTAYKDWGTKPEFTKGGEKKWKGYAELSSYLEVPMRGKVYSLLDNVYVKEKSTYDIGNDREKLRVFSRFLNTKTSTIDGWKANLRNFRERVGARANVKITENQFNEFWRIYNAMVEQHTAGTSYKYEKNDQYMINELQQTIWEEMNKTGQKLIGKQSNTLSSDTYAQMIIEKVGQRLSTNYEMTQKAEREKELQAEQRAGRKLKLTSRGFNE